MQELTDLEMLKDDTTWVQYPFLPIKRNKEVATVIATSFPQILVVMQNMFAIMDHAAKGKSVRDFEIKEYATAQDVLSDGWMVD